MPEHRTPLPALLAGFLEAAVNRFLALDHGTPERLQRLHGKRLQIHLDGLDIPLRLAFDYGSVQISAATDADVDARISGTPVALFLMAAPESVGDWGLPGSGVRIEGDANLARDIGRVFSGLDPDWKAPLSGVFGETLGQQLAAGLVQGAESLREAAGVIAGQLREYPEAPGGMLVSRREANDFYHAVDELREATDRLEARLRHRSARDT